MEKEIRTVELMIAVYCHGNHNIEKGLCGECKNLLGYVRQRLEKCPFRKNKPKCSDCEVHCYKADMRQRIKEVMRYAGIRILFKHPILAGRHYLKKNFNK